MLFSIIFDVTFNDRNKNVRYSSNDHNENEHDADDVHDRRHTDEEWSRCIVWKMFNFPTVFSNRGKHITFSLAKPSPILT